MLGLLRAAAQPDDPARVINIASVDGLKVPDLETYSYSASKGGIIHLTRHLAKRLASEHITVNAIAPGPFDSKMMAFILDNPRHGLLWRPLFPSAASACPTTWRRGRVPGRRVRAPT